MARKSPESRRYKWLECSKNAQSNSILSLKNCRRMILDQFIAGLKDKLIKKVCPHALADLATVIRHAKNYEMAMKEANHTKLTNLQRKLKATLQTNNNSSNNHKDIYLHNDTTKTILDHYPITKLKIVIIVEFQNIRNKIAENYRETSKTGIINITLHYNNLIINYHYQLITHQNHKIKTQYQTPPTQQYQFHTQPSYLTMQEESDFQQTALSEDEIAASKSNPSNNTILPAQITQNANLSDIFPFEFEANKSPFLLSNTTANE
ncbi:hypothetical protein G9A89_014592 [Geosiphon pyriformis]|nr:hypothetical protein G9A89_014592 [Geosiphon pyriformis]